MRKNRLSLPDHGDVEDVGVDEVFGLTDKRAAELTDIIVEAFENNTTISGAMQELDKNEFTENEWAFICLGFGFSSLLLTWRNGPERYVKKEIK